MIWIFGLATGLLFDLPVVWWIIGFVWAILAMIWDQQSWEYNEDRL